MERHAVILGLSRQAKLLGLPMPYMMAVGALTMLPFIWFKVIAWLLTGPIWYGLARAFVAINPNNPAAVRLDDLGYTDLTDSPEDMKIRVRDRQIPWPYVSDG